MLNFLIGFPLAGSLAMVFWEKWNKGVRTKLLGAIAVTELSAALAALFCLISKAGEYVWTSSLPGICGFGLHFCMDGFRALYVAVAAFMWAVSILFSMEYMEKYEHQGRYYVFLLLTLGATAGVFLSADLFTCFIFFEIMSLASYVWVAQDEKPESLRAAETYLAVAVIGGMVMLMGLFLLYHSAGTLEITELPEAAAAMTSGEKWSSGLCLLFGFGAKAGAFPLHIWLPKAHPVAPAPASALLSGMLTKCGIFGVLILSLWMFAGEVAWGELILCIGTVTMVLGAVLALFSTHLKRTLACSSISQIGFILVGAGMAVLLGGENRLALRGTLLHMVNHSLIKLVLFSVAGVVYMRLHRLELNDIRGFGRDKPLLALLFLAGAWSIAGLPFGSGYVSKTLLHESIIEYIVLVKAGGLEMAEAAFGQASAIGLPGLGMEGTVTLLKTVEWLFLISGGLTFAYMSKLFVAIFIEKGRGEAIQEHNHVRSEGKHMVRSRDGKYMNPLTAIALGTAAAVLVLMGLLPGILMDGMADMCSGFLRGGLSAEKTAYYSMENLKGASISILIGIAVYFTVVRRWMIKDGEYINRLSSKIDLEERVYRPLIAGLLLVCAVVMRFCDRLTDSFIVGLRRTVYRDAHLPHELEEGTIMTHMVGVLMDDGKEVLNHTLYRKHPLRVSFEHKLALWQSELEENNTIIARSLSFGLMLFCAGLLFTLIYMLL